MQSQFIVLGLLVVAMWFLIIRPQQQRQKQHRQTVAALEPGKRIVTIGGLVGDVVSVSDDRVVLRVADGGTVEYLRDAVSRVLPDESGEPGSEHDALDAADDELEDDVDDAAERSEDGV